ncbi:MAG: efflux RND transporter periplasmic adaptor subunit [Puniceicoccales bacterium]|jgi:multidrug efflux system membrane fusion protein|nr:efflux RND transporter periplasmic adaptor subunit [Puniceicoccales bacterium]
MKKKIYEILAVAALLCGCGKPAQTVERIVPVKIFTAVECTVPVYVDAVGTCVAYDSVDVVAQVSGRILSEHFEQGQPVEKGQLLYRIDSRLYDAQLLQAHGNVKIAEAQLALDRARLERTQPLAVGHYVSSQDFASLRAAVEQSEGRLEIARGELKRAETMVDFCSVRAPIGGVAGCKLSNVGNLADGSSQRPLLKIQSMDPLYVDFSISENDFPRLHSHFLRNGYLDCRVQLLSDATKTAAARLEIINNQVTPQSGNVKLRAVLNNGDRTFWPGESVRVRVILDQIEKAVVAPEVAIGTRGAGKFVFVVGDGNVADIRPVQVGQIHGTDAVFSSGLRPGEKVVVEGQFLLAPRTRVAVGGEYGSAVQPVDGARNSGK